MIAVKVYSEPDHAPPSAWRSHLLLILKAHWGDGTDWDRSTVGYLRDWFQLVDDMRDADLCLLPLIWNYYADQRRTRLAYDFAMRAERVGKPVAIWSHGDQPARIPISHLLLFQYAINQSRRRPHEYALSPFTRDYPAEFMDGQIKVRQKGAQPVVGFCGQARLTIGAPILILARNLIRHGESRLGRSGFEPPPLRLYTDFRASVLRRLQQSPQVQTDFVIRESYGGRQTQHERLLEFVDNLRRTDYTVCMRGWGNYSIRFCETLSMGRIPIFINTDSALPYDFALDWKHYCVWVEESELDRIGEIVAAFHARLSNDDFIALQHACRRLWEERLTQESYYRHFHEHLRHAGVITA